ncbi:MAG: (Fe-S)-binding protein [Bacillota bacterium]|nr:(Fe-S)-binding protein [Bacillota bacterium]
MSAQQENKFTTLEQESLICARCGYCRNCCPIYRVIGWESASPRGKLTVAKDIYVKGNKNALSDEFIHRITQCTLCGACNIVCSTSIDLRELWLEQRRRIAEGGKNPKALQDIRKNIVTNKNITTFNNDDRLEWAEDLDDPEIVQPRSGAEIAYFVGCVSSFFPQAAQIPMAIAEVFDAAGVDFTTMGGEEWCCGFPLIISGYPDDAREFRKHNVEKIKEMGISTLVASCASCYHTWKQDSREELAGYGLEILHTTEYLARLIEEGRIELDELDEVVTYHDPCDLGRNGGVFDAPRKIITSIPGVKFVELAHHGMESLCCGGGGNLQSVDPPLAKEITKLRVEEIKESGATIVVSACQQCEQMLSTAIREAGLPVRVMDISQLILEAMG